MRTPALCFLDMDDVIAGFISGVKRVLNQPHAVVDRWQMHECFDVTRKELWEAVQREGLDFWTTLPKTPWADALIEACSFRFGKDNLAILTDPSYNHTAAPGKWLWLEKHYPWLLKRVVMTKSKGLVGGPGKWLIDDKDANVEEFVEAGGSGIVLPQLWNSEARHSRDPLAYVERILGTYNMEV